MTWRRHALLSNPHASYVLCCAYACPPVFSTPLHPPPSIGGPIEEVVHTYTRDGPGQLSAATTELARQGLLPVLTIRGGDMDGVPEDPRRRGLFLHRS